jgi:hypothetical protein
MLYKNPLENINYLKDQAGVMVQGRWYSKEMINKKLKEIEAAYTN